MAVTIKAVLKTQGMGQSTLDSLIQMKSITHLPVQLHGQYRVGVAVVADLSSFLKVANF